jgi:hypothetical protein
MWHDVKINENMGDKAGIFGTQARILIMKSVAAPNSKLFSCRLCCRVKNMST